MLETGVGQSDGKLLTPCRTFCGLRLGCKRRGRCKVLRSIAGGWISFKFLPGRHDGARGTVSRVLDALCSIPRRLCCLSSNTLRPGRTQYPSYPSTNAVSNDTKVPNQMASVGEQKSLPAGDLCRKNAKVGTELLASLASAGLAAEQAEPFG